MAAESKTLDQTCAPFGPCTLGKFAAKVTPEAKGSKVSKTPRASAPPHPAVSKTTFEVSLF